MNYTPGPWEVNVTRITAGKGNEFKVIARVEGVFADRGKENSILLAAAPELFEALNEVLTTSFGQEFDFACEKARNLINEIRRGE